MRTICLDFDGVLNNYTGWRGPDHLGEPLPGAQEFVRRLHDDGWTIAICSARGLKGIGEWLMRWGFTGMGIQLFNEKPAAMVYLDDRGVTFTGDYDAALVAIEGFRAWWEAPDSDGGVARVK